MERRNEPRLKVSQAVTLTVLNALPSYALRATVQDVSGSGVQLRASNPIPCGTPVEIESQNSLLRGEVCRCDPEDGGYRVGIQLLLVASSDRPRSRRV